MRVERDEALKALNAYFSYDGPAIIFSQFTAAVLRTAAHLPREQVDALVASVAFDDEGNVTDASGRALLDAINATARAAAAFDLEGRDRHLDRRDLLARDQSSRGSSSIAAAPT